MDGVVCTPTDSRAIQNPVVVSKLPIIAISGNIHNYTPDEFRRLGFDDFIQKPLDYDKVLATVKKISELMVIKYTRSIFWTKWKTFLQPQNIF
jgi:FixJ family two-component response regulator